MTKKTGAFDGMALSFELKCDFFKSNNTLLNLIAQYSIILFFSRALLWDDIISRLRERWLFIAQGFHWFISINGKYWKEMMRNERMLIGRIEWNMRRNEIRFIEVCKQLLIWIRLMTLSEWSSCRELKSKFR